MATIYKSNGTLVTVEPKNGTDFQLEELQAIVGGYIEVVYLSDDEIMVVNEEGKILGLPLNIKATERFHDDLIVGDVLVCKASEVK